MSLLVFIFVFLLSIILLKCFLQVQYQRFRRNNGIVESSQKVIAFFHPFCNAGGGGERVLWSAIRILHRKNPNHCYVIYSDNYGLEAKEIMYKAQDTFQLDLEIPVKIIYLRSCLFLSAKFYPVFTIFGQCLGSMLVGLEALFLCPPDIVIDTMGASFIYPIFRFVGFAKVCAYVHYPIISLDMIDLVSFNVSTYNNRHFIAQSRLLTAFKLTYYRWFAFVYRWTGKCANVLMVNSTWTKNHIVQIWQRQVAVVYPPCNVENLSELSLLDKNPYMIISVSQFRPEKNHLLQLESFAKLMEIMKSTSLKHSKLSLLIVGSCRNEDDAHRVQNLQEKCLELNIQDYVKFKVNIKFSEIEKLMQQSSIAIHTMKNEHFGISVVEFLAAGLLTIAHNSGGPKLDIIQENETGFLAENSEEFAQRLFKLFSTSEDNKLKIRKQARNSISRFSQNAFDQSFLKSIEPIFY